MRREPFDIERSAVRDWLCTQDPDRLCGIRASRRDNPLSRYLVEVYGLEEAAFDCISVRCVTRPRPPGTITVFPTPVWVLAFLAQLNQPGLPAAVTVQEAEAALTYPLQLTRAQFPSSVPAPHRVFSPVPPGARWRGAPGEEIHAIAWGLNQLLFSPPLVDPSLDE